MTIARPYQTTALDTVDAHHVKRRGCVVVLPTGAGKTVVAALHILRVFTENPDAYVLFLQHTEELIEQNMATVAKATGLRCTIVKGDMDDWSGQVVFASVPTLARRKRLASLPAFTNMVVDECHHSAADGWSRVLDKARARSPKLRTLGLSATPERGDGLPLPKVLGDVVFRVFIQELIDLGHLVPPRAYSVALGDAQERIGRLGKSNKGEGDQSEVARILNTPLYNKAVVDQWLARAKGRPTVAFCSTVQHAKDVAEAFREAGVRAAAVDYADKDERRRVLAAYKAGELDVVTNCLLLTEGFDHQPTSCVIVLRAMIHASTFMQALGRALRTVDAERFPGVLKWDAICLDFSGAAERHRELDEATSLSTSRIDIDDLVANNDNEQQALPLGDVEEDEKEDFAPILHEVDLSRSQFRWTDIHGDGRTLLASGLCGFATVFRAGDQWMALGETREGEMHVMHHGARAHAFAAACDWIRMVEKDDRAVGDRRWLDQAATDGQRRALARSGLDDGRISAMGRYEASCRITYSMAQGRVKAAARRHMEAAERAKAA